MRFVVVDFTVVTPNITVDSHDEPSREPSRDNTNDDIKSGHASVNRSQTFKSKFIIVFFLGRPTSYPVDNGCSQCIFLTMVKMNRILVYEKRFAQCIAYALYSAAFSQILPNSSL